MSEGSVFAALAKDDFGRARKREILGRILAYFTLQKTEMLSLGDVKTLLKPESEHYQGMQAVPIELIVGSEGRYRDFNREFLPKSDKLMSRWTRVDMAHYQNVILPPVRLFEVGGVYFVRDGNHRVSVAKAQGSEFINAEVTSLETEIPIVPDMTREELKRSVIEFEEKRFFAQTGLCTLRPDCRITFTEVGRYDEVLDHVRVHKWYLNLRKTEEIPYQQALLSWYDNVYMPVVRVIREEELLGRFPQATESDLYVFIGRHWAELSKRYGPLFTLEEAAEDLSAATRFPRLARFWRALRKLSGKVVASRLGGGHRTKRTKD